ncbi:hypothetical protein JW905_04600 [bacterium]|nr:hypothetical protein [candidate division CSSED10-310 bacterium]
MKLYLGEAITITLKTMPYLLLRAGLYLLTGIFAIVYFAVIGGIAMLIGNKAGGLAAIIVLVATAGFIGIARLLQKYVLYLFKAGHIAVISHIIKSGSLPAGKGQVEFGKDFVKEKVKDVSILFVVDRLVDGVLRSFNRTVARITNWLPVPGMEGLGKLINMVINFAVTFIDEAILSYSLVKEDDNLWRSARTGVILYAQRWKTILLSSAILGFVNWISFLVFFILLLIPTLLIASSDTVRLVGIIVAAILAYLIRLSVVYPFAMTSIIITYHREIEGVQPDAEWEGKLESLSGKFRELTKRAREAVAPRPEEGEAPDAL